MRITVDGVETVINHLNNLPKDIDAKAHELLNRLARIGINTAEIGFHRAEGSYDGTFDVSVTPEPIWRDEKTLVIEASGTAVLFVEFGAGVYNVPYPVQTPPEILPRGEYGKGFGKRKAWGFYGEGGELVITHGNAPARAMFDASMDIRAKITEIAKEVFSR